MKNTLILPIVILLVLLCACASNDQTVQTPETTVSTPIQSSASTGVSEPPETIITQPPTDPPAPYKDPLTGEPAYEQMTARPFAVMLNNYKSAMPLHGAAEASILYEALTEGGMTRCMGIYSDLASVKTLGSIRSARRHFVNLAISYDAIYVHYGKSTGKVGAQEYMDAMGWNHMDGTDKGYSYFYEDQDRRNGSYPSDACHFLVGQRAVDYAVKYKFPLTRENPLDFGMTFDDNNVLGGDKANHFTIWFNQGGKPGSSTKYTKFNYDEATKTYLSYQYGKDNIDGNTGEILAFRNVLALRAPTKKNDTTDHMIITLEGEGTGYYACNGQLIPIKWSRASAYDPFTYTTQDGTPITFGVGKTYIAIIPTNATVEWE